MTYLFLWTLTYQILRFWYNMANSSLCSLCNFCMRFFFSSRMISEWQGEKKKAEKKWEAVAIKVGKIYGKITRNVEEYCWNVEDNLIFIPFSLVWPERWSELRDKGFRAKGCIFKNAPLTQRDVWVQLNTKQLGPTHNLVLITYYSWFDGLEKKLLASDGVE
jgi:hypothetical protein